MAGSRKMAPLVTQFLMDWQAMGRTGVQPRQSTLVRFAEWFDGQRPHRSAKSLDAVDVQTWFIQACPDISPITRRTYASHIRGFVTWGADRKLFDRRAGQFNPGKTSSRRSRPPLWVEGSFLRKMWEEEGWYWRGLISFMGLTLVRGKELRELRVGHINLHDNEVTISRTKTGDFGDVVKFLDPLPEEMRAYLQAYGKAAIKAGAIDAKTARRNMERYGHALNPDMWLFPLYHSGHNKVQPYVQRNHPGLKIKEKIVAAMTPEERTEENTKGLGTHTLRRSMADALIVLLSDEYKMANAKEIVSALLGHEDERTTDIYLNKTDKRRRRNEVLRSIKMFPQDAAIIPFPAPREAAG